MMYLKNEKGSITLFVLASMLFFMASVTCVQIYIQNKNTAVDKEYRQLKTNYEKSSQEIDAIYYARARAEDASVTFSNISVDNVSKKISVTILVDNIDFNIKTMKYGWVYSETNIVNPNADDIQNWTFVENSNDNRNIFATGSFEDNGYYYLCFMINNKQYWTTIPIS